MLAMLLELPDLESYDLSSLRLITYGASPMPEPVLQECLRRLPQVRFAQSYGMTELSPVATMLGAEHHTPMHRPADCVPPDGRSTPPRSGSPMQRIANCRAAKSAKSSCADRS